MDIFSSHACSFLFTGEIFSNRPAMWSYAAYALTRYALLRSDHVVIKCVPIAPQPYAATRSPTLQLLVLLSQFAHFAEAASINQQLSRWRLEMIQNLNIVSRSLGDQESRISVKAAAVSRVCLPWAHSRDWVVAARKRLLLNATRWLISLETAVLDLVSQFTESGANIGPEIRFGIATQRGMNFKHHF